MRSLDDTLALAARDVKDLPDRGVPNVYWPFRTGNYCCATVTHWLNDFGGHDPFAIENISIRALRADRKSKGYKEGKTYRRGALVLMNFAGGSTAEHIGLAHGQDEHGNTLTYEGNTGPKPGVANPNGFYARVRIPANIVGYLYPPYPKETPAAHVAEPEQDEKTETDMAIRRHTFAKDQKATPGTWKTLELDKKGLYSAIGTPGEYTVRTAVRFSGLGPGQVAQLRYLIVETTDAGKDKESWGSTLTEIHGSEGKAFGQLVDLVELKKHERLRVQLLAPASTVLEQGDVKWR